jgi:hypothetical protein
MPGAESISPQLLLKTLGLELLALRFFSFKSSDMASPKVSRVPLLLLFFYLSCCVGSPEKLQYICLNGALCYER